MLLETGRISSGWKFGKVTKTIQSPVSPLPIPGISANISPATIAALSNIPLPTVQSDDSVNINATTIVSSTSIPQPNVNVGTSSNILADSISAISNIATHSVSTFVEGLFVDTFGRVVTNGWETADGGWTWVTEGGSASDYSVNNGTGLAEDDEAGSATRRVLIPATFVDENIGPNAEILWSVSIPEASTGNAAQAALIVREDGANTNGYFFRIIFGLSNNIQTRISIRDVNLNGGVETTLVDPPGSQASYVGGTIIHVKCLILDSNLSMKCWADGDPEPDDWQAEVTDLTFPNVGRIGLRASADTGFTGTLPLIFTYHQFEITIPTPLEEHGIEDGVTVGHFAGSTTLSGQQSPSNGQTYTNRVFTSPGSWNVRGSATNVTFTNCTFQGNPATEHVRVEGSNWLFDRCRFTGSPANHAVKVDGRSALTGSARFVNCRFEGTPGEDHIQFEGQEQYQGGNNQVEHCEFSGNCTEDNIDIKPGAGVRVRYCIFDNNPGGEGLLSQNGTGITTIQNNIFDGVFHSFGAGGADVTGRATGNIYQNGATLRLRKSSDLLLESNTFDGTCTIIVGTSSGGTTDDPDSPYFKDNILSSGTSVNDQTELPAYATGNSFNSTKFGFCTQSAAPWYP